jgi:cardiolipin synthase C
MRARQGWQIKCLLLALLLPLRLLAAQFSVIDDQIEAHPGQSGAFVLERGQHALIARAWLADHAVSSIDIQYFIWSTDNIGILAAESVLRAAERGVKVRIIVDDMLIDAPDKSLLAMAMHPNIDIRIYNPKLSVGVPLHKKAWNAVTDFRGINQRMHDKTFMVDGKVAITGGRNMSSEYFDYHAEYTFRDRDVLLLGPVVGEMRNSFDAFWNHPLAKPVEELYAHLKVEDLLTKKWVLVSAAEVEKTYKDLHTYAAAPDNYSPLVRAAIANVPHEFPRLAQQLTWSSIRFISDAPGKNATSSLSGGGATTALLASLVANAKQEVLVQSPYLVLSDEAISLFRDAIARGVRVRIGTNSLASTDNLPAFSGYQRQRASLLKMGIEIFEYRPDAATPRQWLRESLVGQEESIRMPIFGLHAKTLVVDRALVFIGTYNLDPRSENLNTEVGALIQDSVLAQQVSAAIEIDIDATNSWNAADQPDQHSSFLKRTRARMWRLAPIALD